MNKKGFPAFVILALCLLLPCSIFASEVKTDTLSGYLKAMKIDAKSDPQGNLVFKTGFSDGKQYSFLCVTDAKNKYVYLAVIDIMKLSATSLNLCEITKKMAALNYGMMMAKLEWDEKGKEVRLSTTLSTEDGLSSKRFAAALTTLIATAEQVDKKLK